jgi:cytochrome c peroxidase
MSLRSSIRLLGAVGAVTLGAASLEACHDARERPPAREYTEPSTHPESPPELRRLRAALQALPDAVEFDQRKMELGRRLFHDTALSVDNTLSCASCHAINQGGTDRRRTSLGVRGQVGGINSPTVFNSRYHFVQFWDGRAANLREQAAGPVANPVEMGQSWPNVVATLSRSPDYVAAFRESYPRDGLTEANIRDAIAVYEEALITPAPIDRFLRGDDRALNDEQREGARLFESVGCTTCHNGINIGGGSYQRMGAVRDYFALRGTPLTHEDEGRFNVTHREADRRLFKVPTLRNVAETGPWFHDGHATTLEDAVRTMAAVQLGRDLDATQVQRIVAFLRSTTGTIPAYAALPPNR